MYGSRGKGSRNIDTSPSKANLFFKLGTIKPVNSIFTSGTQATLHDGLSILS